MFVDLPKRHYCTSRYVMYRPAVSLGLIIFTTLLKGKGHQSCRYHNVIMLLNYHITVEQKRFAFIRSTNRRNAERNSSGSSYCFAKANILTTIKNNTLCLGFLMEECFYVTCPLFIPKYRATGSPA